MSEPLVTIPGIPGTWQPEPWDVERLAVGQVIQYWRPRYAQVTAIVPLTPTTMTVTLDDKVGEPEPVIIPSTNAAQAANGLILRRLRQPLPVRSWWFVQSGNGAGSTWYARADGRLYCDDPGPSSFVNGSVATRAQLGTLIPA